MLFPTFTFAAFFLAVFVGNWLLMSRPRAWKLFILVVSLVFYGWWDWRFVALLALSAVANQAFARSIERAQKGETRKWLLVAAVAANLGVLGWFKYYGFFVTSVANMLAALHFSIDPPLLEIILPLGISFLTFRVLSYVIDVYRGSLRTASLMDFAIYIAFFPYIMAGPIARASEFLPQLKGPRDPRDIDASRAFFLIFAGLAKKILIADYIAAHVVNGVFTTPGSHTSAETLLAIVGYSVQIYCDFSAYSDIAIGVSLLLGFRLPENFDRPYTAVSVQDFWRRWHMTLSRWLRDYLYIPLGGNRKGRVRTYVNLMVTMLLAGLWHGAGWPFLLWGGLHGVALVVEHRRLARRRPPGAREEERRLYDQGSADDDLARSAKALAELSSQRVARPLPARARVETDAGPWGDGAAARLGVFAFVTFAWVFFRSATFGAALAVLAQLFRDWGSLGDAVTPVAVLVVAAGIAIQYVPRSFYERLQIAFSALSPVMQGVALAVGFLLLDVFGPTSPALFIYYKF
jgi:D-alanyl-lipoteichoic acid acyltransferase DltB (MBOAT superfamily)